MIETYFFKENVEIVKDKILALKDEYEKDINDIEKEIEYYKVMGEINLYDYFRGYKHRLDVSVFDLEELLK